MRKAAYLATFVVACTLPSFVSAGPPSLGGHDDGTAITLIAGGCGIGWHRGPYGGCRRNGTGAYVPPPGFSGPPGAALAEPSSALAEVPSFVLQVIIWALSVGHWRILVLWPFWA
jgi:hypothetical protein